MEPDVKTSLRKGITTVYVAGRRVGRVFEVQARGELEHLWAGNPILTFASFSSNQKAVDAVAAYGRAHPEHHLA